MKRPIRVGTYNIQEILSSEKPVLMLFHGNWERGSRSMYNQMRLIPEKYDNLFLICIADYDYAPDIFSDFKIWRVPTLMFIEDGKEAMRREGYNGTFDIERFIFKFFGISSKDNKLSVY